MTRDEALKIMRIPPASCDHEERWIDRFVALGLLKLDEPKSIIDRATEALQNYPRLQFTSPHNVLQALEGAGLKIVEK